MGIFDRFESKPAVIVEKTEIEVLEVELLIATDDRLIAQLAVDRMAYEQDHDWRYRQYKHCWLRETEFRVSVVKTKLRAANVKRAEEQARLADAKRYELSRRSEIANNSAMNALKDVMKSRMSAEEYESIISEAGA